MRTTGGQRLLKATLPDRTLPARCAAHPGAAPKAPEIEAEWFPEGVETRPTVRCGLYYVSLDGDTLYAWQLNDDWLNAGADR
ncbi:hypothetical protein AB0D46_32700 [Streptomyces sp. NPDC048383]|uniref:hypothetical protein n=1 Tax=Streptomyces sp. NPDC048383 TaxID=3155386 RepID=UPI003432DA69